MRLTDELLDLLMARKPRLAVVTLSVRSSFVTIFGVPASPVPGD
jgi:hypothetical protein